jgi:hypothetical protein
VRGYHTTTVIGAPPARVWEILTDFSAYPDWNPLIGEAHSEGPPGPGCRLVLDIVPLGRRYRPRITVWDPPRRLAWSTWEWLPLLLTSVHYFRLDPEPGGGSRLHHGERFQGLAVPLLGSFLIDRMHQAFIHHDLALKQRAEGSGPTSVVPPPPSL